MKRQRFRLGSVLKHYEVQKQRAEQDLQQAIHALCRIDEEIERLNQKLAALAASMSGKAGVSVSPTAWIACSRMAAHLSRSLDSAQANRVQQAEFVAKRNEVRKRWAIAEETLLLLRRKIETTNEQEEAHAEKVQLQEMILRRALGHDVDDAPVI